MTQIPLLLLQLRLSDPLVNIIEVEWATTSQLVEPPDMLQVIPRLIYFASYQQMPGALNE